MKKYLFIIIIITMLLLACWFIWIYPKSQSGISNQISQNDSNSINEIITETINMEDGVEENNVSQEETTLTTVTETTKSESEEKKSSSSKTTSSSSTSIDKSKGGSTTSKSSTHSSSKATDSKDIEKDKSSFTKASDSTSIDKSTTQVQNDDKENIEVKNDRCTKDDNHGIKVGNTGKWFNTKDEAIAYYKSEIEYWGTWWESTDPEDTEADEKYYKNCPTGYNVFSCMYCNKWTINFYYR